jgi:cell surface protein SprA
VSEVLVRTLDSESIERSREDHINSNSTNLDLGKLLPKNAAIQLPVYTPVSTDTSSTPEYDPYDQDVKIESKIDAASSNVGNRFYQKCLSEDVYTRPKLLPVTKQEKQDGK